MLGKHHMRTTKVNELYDLHIDDTYHTIQEPCTLISWKLEAEKPLGKVEFSLWKRTEPYSLDYTYLGKTTPTMITQHSTVILLVT